jgi:hypothetical protein
MEERREEGPIYKQKERKRNSVDGVADQKKKKAEKVNSKNK